MKFARFDKDEVDAVGVEAVWFNPDRVIAILQIDQMTTEIMVETGLIYKLKMHHSKVAQRLNSP